MRWQTKPALIVFSTAVALCGVLAAISDPNLARLGLWSTPYSLLVAGLGFRFIASTSPWKDPRTQAGWATALILFTNGSVLGAVGAGGLTLAMFFPNIDLVAISLTLLMSCIYAGVGSLVSTIGVPVGYLVGRSLLADCVEDDGSKNHPL